METYYFKVYGKVQKVGFRRYTRRIANDYGIKGWVLNNNEDASVEIFAQGPEEKLKLFVEAIKKGPKKAKVERIEFLQHQSIKIYQHFKIRR